jgi:hypothetical protein
MDYLLVAKICCVVIGAPCIGLNLGRSRKNLWFGLLGSVCLYTLGILVGMDIR